MTNNMLDINCSFWKRDHLHLRNMGAPPVSSEGEGSPIIWAMYMTCNNENND